MILKHKQIAIVGAGPVGLTMARLLQQNGLDVTVYERDENAESRIWGGTLDLHPGSGQMALEAAGLLQKYYDHALPMGVIHADAQAKVLSVKEVLAGHERDNPEINRNVLRQILLDSLMPGTVRWDHKCINLEAKDGKWNLHFSSQEMAVADLVIGANGGMSAIRGYVTDAEVVETGTMIIQGDVPQPANRCSSFYNWCDGHRLMAAQGGNMIGVNPWNGDRLTYGVIFEKPLDWEGLDFSNQNQVTAFLKKRFEGWNQIYHELFDTTTLYMGLATRILPLNKPWRTNRPLPITLIGDAAHLMPPFAGEGVNSGLMDATLLAANLTDGKFDTVASAIHDYERKMFNYASSAQNHSRENELKMRKPDFYFAWLMGNRTKKT